MPTIAEQIEHLKRYDPKAPCAMHLWTTEDVETKAAEMGLKKPTAEETASILDRLESRCDSTQGMNWDVLQCHIEEEGIEEATA